MNNSKRMLVTGGAGFIGVHTAHHFATTGWNVHIVDNLSRQGTQCNLDWLQKEVETQFHLCDLRNYEQLRTLIKQMQPDVIIHLAAQVAVTTSVKNPREDFEINALDLSFISCYKIFFLLNSWI